MPGKVFRETPHVGNAQTSYPSDSVLETESNADSLLGRHCGIRGSGEGAGTCCLNAESQVLHSPQTSGLCSRK